MPPSANERRLLAVHAHPDDESITTGGLLARCSEVGVVTCLVTCTDGRYGPVNPDLGLSLTPAELAAVRAKELGSAAQFLGVSHLHTLGHHDSGMTGSSNNMAPEAFWAQPMDMLVRELTAVIRFIQPHAVVTYDAFGNTGHPDHIQAHRATHLAIAAAAEAHAFPDTGLAWSVGLLLYPVFPISAMEQFIADDLASGRSHPFDGRSAAEINYTRSDDSATHRVSLYTVYDRKRDALQAHQTQVGSHHPQLYRAALARREYEHFRAMGSPEKLKLFGDILEPM
jgi:N-acetyl-1-D-myo-inositol-2-amino-2-deoxy-alpha-D-glucopyranoside deacetylase